MSDSRRLQLLVSEPSPGFWSVQGLEHDVAAEARSMSEAVRAVVQIVNAHTTFDANHRRPALSAFRPAPRSFWNAFSLATPVSLDRFGAAQPASWDIVVAVARGSRGSQASEALSPGS